MRLSILAKMNLFWCWDILLLPKAEPTNQRIQAAIESVELKQLWRKHNAEGDKKITKT